jgi:hypothetical protein
MPDLYVAHEHHGARWIEVKRKDQYSFTRTQRTKFLELISKNINIWILVGFDEQEYRKLFAPMNFFEYWKD